MEKLLVKQVYRETEKYSDQTISILGWIRTLRSSKAFGFIEINDGSFFKNIQVVFEEDLENFAEIAFADLKDDIKLAEDMMKYIINYVMENAPEEMEFFNSFVDKGLIERAIMYIKGMSNIRDVIPFPRTTGSAEF